MPSFDASPFAPLTLIAAPAILTNASSVLALGAGNRFARAVNRQRQLSTLLESHAEAADRELGALRLRQLHRTERRGQLLLRALTGFYVSLGSFAMAALVSLLGATVLNDSFPLLGQAARWLALIVGMNGVCGLVFGRRLLVRETRIALSGLEEEAPFSSRRFQMSDAERSRAVAPPPDRTPDRDHR